ncbi:hypothetical protein JCGZ_10117 [Jatropha curcas]|uniref:F-box domain-containing protein n=1 Tax=Jatropha curcas TaxID=180498 RepID=A0A067LD27_JATCU|nr:hypothetical protein JCGZ_10117 [Jatropha curcas]
MVDENQIDLDGGGRWLQLPDDVMAMIIGRLDIIDRANMSCVCKLWKSLIGKGISVASVQLPWILLPHDWGYKQISFYNMYRGKIHTFDLPKSVLEGRCCASSKGWVLIVKGSETKPKLVLLNPISGEIVHLPSITTIPSYYDFLEELRYPYDFSAFINKIELSSDDASTFIISANICESSVAICKPNDNKWTALNQQRTIGFGGQLAQLVQEEEDYCLLENVMLKSYLVESSHGELLILHKIFDGFRDELDSDNDEEEDSAFYYFRTREFKVYKTDQSNGNGSLDDQVLFVGNSGSSISLPATELNSFRLKGNSIHFLTDMDYQD